MNNQKPEIEELFIEELAEVQGGIRPLPGTPRPPVATTYALGEESSTRPFGEHVITTMAFGEEGGSKL